MSNTKSAKTSTKLHRIPFYKRPYVLISMGIILVVLAVTVVIILSSRTTSPPDEAQPNTQPTPTVSDDDNLDKITPAPSESDPGQTPTQYEGTDPNTLTGLTGSITLKSYADSTLTVAVVIDQYLSASGTCTLNLKQNNHTILTETLKAAPDITTSGCGPFRISAPDLSGVYQIEVNLNGDGKGGTVTDEITI